MDLFGKATIHPVLFYTGKIIGYFVLETQKYHGDYRTGVIVELVTDPKNKIHIIEVIGYITDHYNKNNINVINTNVVKNSILEKELKKYGFINQKEKIHLFYETETLEEDIMKTEKSDPSKIFISYGDIWL